MDIIYERKIYKFNLKKRKKGNEWRRQSEDAVLKTI